MQKKMELSEYLPLQKFLHWFMALLILILIILGFVMKNITSSYQALEYMIHKSIGISVLFLMIIRFVYVMYKGKPRLPVTVPLWQRILARAVQYNLIFFILCMALSGWIMSTASNKIPKYFDLFYVPFPGISYNQELAQIMQSAHNTIIWILLFLIFLHISGALKHHFIDKDNVLLSMLPRFKKSRKT